MLDPRAMATIVAGAHLNEQVYEEIRARVLTRRHAPGAKLSLHGLASELGVSRSPVHHALTRLVAEGLLSVQARRGYYVTPVTAVALAEGYDVRLALELHAAERTLGGLGAAELSHLRSLLDATADAISHSEWDTANAAFHEYQIDLAGNALLSRFYRELSVNRMMQVIRGGRVEGHEHLVTEHGRIVEAFEAGDLEAARQAIHEHIETGRRIAIEALERSGGVL
jgi:DNA-binding GntR family transcriptional regulator